MNLNEVYEQKNKALADLTQKYGLPASETSLIGNIAYVCESQRTQDGQQLFAALSRPMKDSLSKVLPDKNLQLQLLGELAKLVKNGYNAVANNNYVDVNPTTDPRIKFADEQTQSRSQTELGEPTSPVAENISSDNITIRLAVLLNSLNDHNFDTVVAESNQLIDQLKSLINSEGNDMTEQVIEKTLQEVTALKNLVIKFIVDNRGGSDRKTHDALQAPLAFLESNLSNILEKKMNPVRNVSHLIKLG